MAHDELSNTLAPPADDGPPEPELLRDHVELQRARLQLETARAELERAELHRRRLAVERAPLPCPAPARPVEWWEIWLRSDASPDWPWIAVALGCLGAAALALTAFPALLRVR